MNKLTLLRSAAVGAVLTFGMGAAAHAAEAAPADCVQKCEKPVHHRHHKMAPKPVAENPLVGEVAALKAQVSALEARLDASNAAAQQAQASAAQAQASATAAQAAAQSDAAAISQIPGQVSAAVGKLPKPKSDALYFRDGKVKLTLGGFVAAESVWRQRGEGADFSLPMANTPYAGVTLESAHTGEWRQTARQSRISGLIESDVTSNIHLTGYGEFDFLGAAQTANSNESNSFNPRIRHLYLTADWKDLGLSLLAGQTWSLATLNNNGITPRSEVLPATIDAQYTAGFVWARQPQVRLTKNFGNGIWAAASLETPATNSIGGTAALNANLGAVTFNQVAQGGSLFNNANNISFNHVPDVVVKVATDQTLEGHHVHAEVFGLYRDFYDRVGSGSTGCTVGGGTACTSFHNTDTSGGGFGFGLVGQIAPGLLDGQISGLFGKGIGRYGTSQFSDVYERANGSLEGINESALLAGLTLHATPMLDVYGYVGREQARASSYVSNQAKQGGYGNVNFSNLGGCETPSMLACSGNTKFAEEATIGFWNKAYSGDFGSLRFGLQYSYVKRESFNGTVAATTPVTIGSVHGDENMIYTSIRFYPFQK